MEATNIIKWEGKKLFEALDKVLQEEVGQYYFLSNEKRNIFVIANPDLESGEIEIELRRILESGTIRKTRKKVSKSLGGKREIKMT